MNCLKPTHSPKEIRPYRLLCAICSLADDAQDEPDERIQSLLTCVREAPDSPITPRCNVCDVFKFQDPGPEDDTPEGLEFNMKRDMEILLRLNLPPGTTLPARALFHRVLDTIENVTGICSFPSTTADAWKGCPKAAIGLYQKGRAKGIAAIIPPRDDHEMKKDKRESLQAIYAAATIKVRPHILLCSVCQYGNGIRPPYPPDNLPEMLELILKQPNAQIELAPCADWMMCAPCPDRVPDLNACVTHRGAGGLTNQLRDLRVLQKLGLSFGSTLNARALYQRIFERIPGTLEICFLDRPYPSLWWDPCGVTPTNSEAYEKGKRMLQSLLLK